MQHAHKQPTLPFTRTMLAPVVALVIGAAGLAGAYVVIDDDASTTDSGVTAIRGTPVVPSQTKDEAATAAAIGNPGASSSQGETKDESAIAAAIGNPGSQGETKDEAAIAAAIAPSPQGSPGDEAERAKRTDPHGPASALP